MNDKIHYLTPPPPPEQPDPEVVKHLRMLLQKAESGEVTSIVYVAQTAAKTFYVGSLGVSDPLLTLGQINRLGHNINRQLDESRANGLTEQE